ncbi:hypothetical protein C8J57DRAFT_1240987 [Mycena rebaudengoi]|nr:hypothetical protein C8J57DRAFT_1240987 [Mycena rebaudengoi]
MSPRRHDSQSGADEVVQYSIAAARALKEVADDDNIPYLQAAAEISLLIMETMQRAKSNKSPCLLLVTQIHEILCALANLGGEFGRDLAIPVLHSIAQFTETLQRIHAYIRSQTDSGIFKQILQTSIGAFGAISQMRIHAAQRHEALIEHQSIERSPKIFYGREAETRTIIGTLQGSDPGRVAILGPGGIGKSALALAVHHDPGIISTFGSNRFSYPYMIGKLAGYFGVEQEGTRAKAVLRHLSAMSGPMLLVLDNMEDCWEPLSSRTKVEEVLSLLSDLPKLHLLVTMRGTERPKKIKWSRPLLAPLTPLTADAARKAFLDVTDDLPDDRLVDKVLALTNNLPLAISLIANLVAYEECETVLKRWKSDNTFLLSAGTDKLSNLDMSIAISLSSARMSTNPNALGMLSILSILPDGLSRFDLENMDLPVSDVSKCVTQLLRCSMVYSDNANRIKVLVPIRDVANLYNGPEFMTPSLIQRISADLGNIRAIALESVANDHEQLADTIRCIIKVAYFTYLTTLGSMEGLDSLGDVVANLGDPQLQGQYLHIMAHFNVKARLEPHSRTTIRCFEEVNYLTGQAKSYRALGLYYQYARNNSKAFEVLTTSAVLAEKGADLPNQAFAMVDLAQYYNMTGNTTLALAHARQARVIARAAGSLYLEARAMRDQRNSAGVGARQNRVPIFRIIVNTEAEICLQQTNYSLARTLDLSLTMPEEAQTGFSYQEISNGYALVNIAFIDMATGNESGADSTINLARSLFTAHGSRFGLSACDITLGDLHFKRGGYAEARRLYRQSYASTDASEIHIICLEKLTDVALASNDMTSATCHATLMLILAHRSGYQAKIHHALRRVLRAEEDIVNSMTLFEVALSGFTLMDIHRARADCMFRMGDIYAQRGNNSAACASWEVARPLFEKSSQREDVLRCEEKLGV